MSATSNIVKFVHFNGTIGEWNQRMADPFNPFWEYQNAVVFAKVWHDDFKCSLKIFAGVNPKGEQYLYDIVDINEFNAIKKLLQMDDAGAFTSNQMNQAIEMYLSKSYTTPNTILNQIRQAITWHDENGYEI